MPESSDIPEPEEKERDYLRLPIEEGEYVQPQPRGKGAPGIGGEDASNVADMQISMAQLMALARTLTAAEQMGPEEYRTVLSRTQRKFSRGEAVKKAKRANRAADPDGPPENEKLVLPHTVEEEDLTVYPTTPEMRPVTARERRTRAPGRRWRIGGSALSILLLITVGLGMGLIWTLLHPHVVSITRTVTAAGKPLAPSMSPQQVDAIDRIMEARKAGDFARALVLCDELRKNEGGAVGLSFQEAQLRMATGDTAGATAAVDRSLQANENVAESYLLHASLVLTQGRNDLALHDFSAAARSAPFAAQPFFLWAEALRRSGHPEAALGRLDEAISRELSPDAEEFYRFKRRLTLIELGRAAELDSDLKKNLASNPQPADWLLIAAAENLHDGKFDAAAADLDRASAEMAPQPFTETLEDSYFALFSHQPALARFYASIEAKKKPAPAPKDTLPPLPPPVAGPDSRDLISPVAPAPNLARPGAPALPAAAPVTPTPTPVPTPTATPLPSRKE